LHATVEYAKVRTQFGQVIGGYQAIQHRCATTAVDIASARSLLVAAARASDRGGVDHGLSLLAKAESSEVFRSAAGGLIQVPGGIRFTWEHDAHLFFRRARSTAVLGGTPEELRDHAVSEGCLDLLLPVSPRASPSTVTPPFFSGVPFPSSRPARKAANRVCSRPPRRRPSHSRQAT